MTLHKRKRDLILGAFFVALAVASNACLAAQTAKPRTPKPQTGTLNGRVFAITAAGDLKPARMADVRIFLISGGTVTGKTAGLIYLEESNKATDAYGTELQQNGINWSEKQTCLKDLHIYDPVLLTVLGWAEANKKLDQVITTQTDEDGNFLAILPPGEYIVTVRGRAGYNEALWDTSPLNDPIIKPGAHLQIKLSSPAKSCLATSD